MDAKRFDAISVTVASALGRRGLLRGAAFAAVALAGRWSGTARADQPPWTCPGGLYAPNQHCICVCASFGHSVTECSNACMACQWNLDPICPNPDERGLPAGPPVCCTDRKPCAFVCGDKPDSEPLADLL